MFVYEIRNTINNKRYIGQTVKEGRRRFQEHTSELRSNNHHNVHLQRAWNKYGENSFEMNILQETNSIDELNLLEEQLIIKYNTQNRNFGYNVRPGGFNTPLAEETKEKISIAKRGISVHTKESKAKIAEYSRNKIHTIESRLKRSEKLKGFVWSEEIRNQWAKSHRKGKEYPILIDPNGIEYNEVVNLTSFAKSHGLVQQSLQRLVTHQLNHHKGWTVRTRI